MRPALPAALTALLASGCAAHVAPRPAPEAIVVCNTDLARWRGGMPLRLPGGGPVFAEAWAYDGTVALKGRMLWQDRGVLEAHLSGRGVALDAEVDLTKDAELRLRRPLRLGDFGLLRPNAPVHLVGASPGRLTVRPVAWSLEGLEAVAPVEASLTCEDTTFFTQPGRAWDPARELRSYGLREDAPRRVLPAGQGAELRAAPDGPVRLRLLPGKGGHSLYVLERRDGWSRVASLHWEGVAWVGWVPTGALETPKDDGTSDLLGVLGGQEDAPPARGCPEPLPLSVRVDGRVARVGRVEAGTPFRVIGEAAEGRVPIDLDGGWLDAKAGAQLLLPARAAACAARPPEPKRDLGSVLESGD